MLPQEMQAVFGDFVNQTDIVEESWAHEREVQSHMMRANDPDEERDMRFITQESEAQRAAEFDNSIFESNFAHNTDVDISALVDDNY
jgi:hypothetical protein